MRQIPVVDVLVVTDDLANSVGACTIWAQHNVTEPQALTDDPQGTTRESRTDLGLGWVQGHPLRNVLFIEVPPCFGQVAGQVFMEEACSYEVSGEAFGGVHALLAEEDTAVGLRLGHSRSLSLFLWRL